MSGDNSIDDTSSIIDEVSVNYDELSSTNDIDCNNIASNGDDDDNDDDDDDGDDDDYGDKDMPSWRQVLHEESDNSVSTNSSTVVSSSLAFHDSLDTSMITGWNGESKTALTYEEWVHMKLCKEQTSKRLARKEAKAKRKEANKRAESFRLLQEKNDSAFIDWLASKMSLEESVKNSTKRDIKAQRKATREQRRKARDQEKKKQQELMQFYKAQEALMQTWSKERQEKFQALLEKRRADLLHQHENNMSRNIAFDEWQRDVKTRCYQRTLKQPVWIDNVTPTAAEIEEDLLQKRWKDYLDGL